MAARLFDSVLRLVPRVSFRLHNLEPPSDVYVTQEDELELDVRNIVGTDPSVQLNGRVLTPREGIKPFSHVVVPDATALTNTFRFTLGEGFLLSVVASTTTSFTARGSMYVAVKIRRGSLVPAQVLTAGYIYLDNALSWPPFSREPSFSGYGRLVSFFGTDPAAGVEVSETIPGNRVFRLLTVRLVLLTSAVAGARTVTFVIDDGVFTRWTRNAAETQPPAVLGRYNLSVLGFTEAAGVSQSQFAIPHGILLRPGFRIRTVTANFDAGDDYEAPGIVAETWLET